VCLSGDWVIDQSQPSVKELAQRAPVKPPSGTSEHDHAFSVSFDTAGLGRWDSTFLIFIRQCQAFYTAQNLAVDLTALPEPVRRLLTLSMAPSEQNQTAANQTRSLAARLGAAVLAVWRDAGNAVSFTGEILIAGWGLMTGRVHMRWREFFVVIQNNSSRALPIVTLIALLMGIIVAFLGVVVLQRFGAGYYVSYLVGFGMLRELAALMTGIIIAGRTGAAFAAELGSMKITEEIDAFTTLGISTVEHLVLPRVLGLFVMMPLLTVYADFVGIIGGMLVSGVLLDLSHERFMNGMLAAVTLPDALFGIVKGTVFGLIVGVSGTMKGLQTGNDASAVGRAATSAVVLGITLIITANAVIDWLAALLDI